MPIRRGAWAVNVNDNTQFRRYGSQKQWDTYHRHQTSPENLPEMAERSRRQPVKRQISDVTDESLEASGSDSDDFDPRRLDAARRGGKQEVQPQISTSPNTTRAKRTTQPLPPASPTSSNGQSIKLTMKVAPSKLREVMRANEVDSLRDVLGGGKVLDGPRSSRSARTGAPSSSQASPEATSKRTGGRAAGKPKYQEVPESDDDAEDENDVDVGMNDFDEIGAEAEGGTDDEEEDEEEESEEEDEEENDDGDVDMEDSPAPTSAPAVKKNVNPPKPPTIKLKNPANVTGQEQPAKPEVVVTPAQVAPLQSVEDQEMEDDEEDEELDDSDLPDDDENELSEEEIEEELDDTNIRQEDLEGATNLNEEDEEDDDDDLSEDESGLGSGTSTPDPGKMTARQRRHGGEELMSLDMAPQQRKFFTDAEKAMKKDEHARKRKELTKRKINEEKTAALNRLLKPQVSKARGAAPKAETLAAQMAAAGADEETAYVERADPLYTRWISSKDGVRLGVPEEWLGKKVGQYFGAPPSNGRLVQEIE